MIHFGWAIGALFFGAILGLFTGCLCSVSGQASREEEKRISSIQGRES